MKILRKRVITQQKSISCTLCASRIRYKSCDIYQRILCAQMYDEGNLTQPSSNLIDIGANPRQSGKTSLSLDTKSNPKLGKEELVSQLDMDYTPLKDLLERGQFQNADDETRALLIKLAGNNAVKRGWLYFSEVQFIPAADLHTINKIWTTYSMGKFGYSVQRELWVRNKRQWLKFFQQIAWTMGDNEVYRKWPAEFIYADNAPRGHLPLTNCLRGTRLLNAIFEHPAFQEKNYTH